MLSVCKDTKELLKLATPLCIMERILRWCYQSDIWCLPGGCKDTRQKKDICHSIDVIRMIFNACHKDATVKNNNGNLALHLAVGFNASNDVIRMKFGAYPESTVVQG